MKRNVVRGAHAIAATFVAIASAAIACTTKSPDVGGVMVEIVNDASLSVDLVHVEIDRGSDRRVLLNQDFRIPQEQALPSTIAIASNGDPTATAILAVSAYHLEGSTRVPIDRRDNLVTQIPVDRTVGLRIVLSAACTPFVNSDATSKCEAGKTCNPTSGVGQCVSSTVDASALAPYTTNEELDASFPRRPDATIGIDASTADADARSEVPEAGRACSPGDTQCAGNSTIQTCSGLGQWDPAKACVKQACVKGSCQGVCAPGDVQCKDNGVETCTPTGTWGVAQPCNGSTCSAGVCTGSCASGTKQCSGNGTQACGGDGTWSAPSACTDQTCVGGSCQGMCAPGQTQCSGNGTQSCASGQWGTPVACVNQTCAGAAPAGGCQGVCAPGQTQCSGNGTQSCNASGQWDAPVACVNQTCAGAAPAGSCQGVCAPGQTQCSGNGVQTCNASGQWDAAVACVNQTCLGAGPAGSCQGVCAPGQTQCSGNGMQTCDASGQWGMPVACVDQTCLGAAPAGTCQGVCAPGQTQCDGITVQGCSGGAWTTTTDLAAPKWSATYGTAADETTVFPSALTQTSDGNYVLVGTSGAAGYAVKFGPTGSKAWSATPGSGLWVALEISTGTAVCGYTTNNVVGCTAGRYCGYCARLSSTGTIDWQESIIPANNDFEQYGRGIAPNGAGGFLVTGYSTVTDPWLDIFLRSYDANGAATSINQTFNKSHADELNQLRRAGDGSYWGAGDINRWDTCQRAYLAHYDGTTGAIKGELGFGACNNELGLSAIKNETIATSVIPLADGSVVVVGQEYAAGRASGFIANYTSFDTAPTQAWKHVFSVGSGDSVINAAELLPDGGFLLVGTVVPGSLYDPAPKGDLYVVRTDSSGTKKWDRVYALGAEDDRATSVLRAADGTYLVGGFSGSAPGAGGTDLYVMDLPAICPP